MLLKKFPLPVLLVDDDGNIRRTLALSLKESDCQVDQASSVEEAMNLLQSRPYDLILTDFKMEKENGLELIKRSRVLRPDQIIVVMTAFASFENAVEVMREGAFDYLPKPFTNAQLSHVLSKVREVAKLRREIQELRQSRSRRNYFSGFTSPASKQLEEFVRKLAPTDGTVLLSGESGTGKSELAKLMHTLSPRNSQPLVTVHCTTLTETLLESELFGHVKGSFTGAVQDKAGKLELAAGGTLFLDEIGDLSPNGQSKFLRFLQDRVFERVGGHKEIQVDARVIAATNKDLPEMVKQGKFREDLYYRLNVLECVLVPLRHRREDIPVLIERLLKETAIESQLPEIRLTSGPVMDALLGYSWPGNIRELRNVLQRLVMLTRGRAPATSDLPESVTLPKAVDPSGNIFVSLEEVEKQHIQRVLSHTKSLEEAAKVLGITTVTLWRKRKEFGLG